ncbi:MAG: ABC transporter permease subunit [Eubacteriales bacterium]|nr:ABC transporter permease subunit [Eubacteriales bacterium]
MKKSFRLQLNPVTAKDLKVTFRGHLLPVLFLVVNACLFTVGILGTLGRMTGMEMAGRMDWRTFLYVYAMIVMVEFVIILITSPSQTAGSIALETESGTYDLMLSSGLTPIRVLFGKLLYACHNTVLIVFSTLPALLVPLVYGGLTLQSVLVTLLFMLPAALFGMTIGLFASSVSRSAAGAFTLSYAILIAFVIVPVLIPFLLRPVVTDGNNIAVYLLAIDPLTPIVTLLAGELGETGLIADAIKYLGLTNADMFINRLPLISMGMTLLISVMFFVLSDVALLSREK